MSPRNGIDNHYTCVVEQKDQRVTTLYTRQAPMEEHLCVVCGTTIGDHRNRRRLESDANKDCLNALMGIRLNEASPTTVGYVKAVQD